MSKLKQLIINKIIGYIMTYCAGVLTENGIVFASDSRTNAGVDHISTFRKMFIYDKTGDRVLVIMTAGNLAITQALIHVLEQQIQHSQTQEKENATLEVLKNLEPKSESKKKNKNADKSQDVATNKVNSLYTVANMIDAARLIGKAIRQVYDSDAEYLKKHGVEFHASVLFGGQIKNERPRLFNIYTAGNFIEATPETPYFQIGESKYGKPIIDRVARYNSQLDEVTKCMLVSFDSTIRSNVSVAMPIEVLCYSKDSLKVEKHRVIDEKDEYFNTLRKGWSMGLKDVFANLPNPTWD